MPQTLPEQQRLGHSQGMALEERSSSALPAAGYGWRSLRHPSKIRDD